MRNFLFIALVLVALAGSAIRQKGFVRHEKLSEYDFFVGALRDLRPAEGVLPYAVNTPLFSNYAEKLRFIMVPRGTSAKYNDTSAFDFPEGTVLIKNFYYPNDFRKPEKGRKLIETRLLVNEAGGWQPYSYIWNEEQSEAYYDPAGETTTVSYIDMAGRRIRAPYVIPNRNQCKGCHSRRDQFAPIGVSARQLNMDFIYGDMAANQLKQWVKTGILDGVPPDVPALAVWDNAATGTLNDRARAYLDANCGHCHSRTGPANTSGLFLDIFETNPSHLGVFKAPVAAGRGAGDLEYDIVPGEPQKSILLFRMKTNDPAIAMPEIGREQVHREGVELIQEWIRKHTFPDKHP